MLCAKTITDLYCKEFKVFKGEYMLKVTVILETDNDNLSASEIEKDIRMSESQIGFYYDYNVVSVEVN